MNITPRKSRQIVDTFKRSNSVIQADTLTDVAQYLRRKYRGGSIEQMVCLLQKARRAERLFEYKDGGQNFYETKEARCQRLKIPKGARKSMISNGISPAVASA